MHEYVIEGDWWLPNQDSRVSGKLISDATGTSLTVNGSLRTLDIVDDVWVNVSPERVEYPAIFGFSKDGEKVTLLTAAGYPWPVDDVDETYRIDAVLIGEHSEDGLFDEIRVGFDFLRAWVDLPAIYVKGGSSSYVIDDSNMCLMKVDFDGGEIGFCAGIEGFASEDEVHFSQYVQFYVTLPESIGWKPILEQKIHPCHDLLTISLGRPVRMTTVHVASQYTDLRRGLSELRVRTIQTHEDENPSAQSITGYDSPMLLRGKEVLDESRELLVRWYEMWQANRVVLTQLLSAYYASFMYSNHKFGAAFQAVEALHKLKFEGQELTKTAHKARVSFVIYAAKMAGVDEPTLNWTRNILQSRNDKSLPQRVDEVVRSTGALGELILREVPDIGQWVSRARAGVAHPGVDKKRDVVLTYWYGELLHWVARASILELVGLEDVFDRVVQNEAFRYVISQIAEDSSNE